MKHRLRTASRAPAPKPAKSARTAQMSLSSSGDAAEPPAGPPPDAGGRADRGSGGAATPSSARSAAFLERYATGEELGRGAFSTVYRVTKRSSGESFAAKVIDLRPLRLRQAFQIARLRREYEIMRRLRNPHIVGLEEVFESADELIIVMEFCPGIELFDAIISQKSIPEAPAKYIFYQVLLGLDYLHRKNILHRDVKPENVLLCTKSPNQAYPIVKLLDFGLSKVIGDTEGGSEARTFVGTPCYVAPEVEANAHGAEKLSYGTAVDLWSSGALLYVMLVARFPEVDRSTGAVDLRTARSSGVSDSALDLIKRLMEPDAALRLGADAALRHDWLKDAADKVPLPMTSVDGVGEGVPQGVPPGVPPGYPPTS